MIQTIVERIYIVDKDDERFCHIFIKGCTDEDYTGFFQTAGYIEKKTTSVCDSEQYCICAQISPQSILQGKACGDVEIPPKMSVSSFMGYLKGKSGTMLYEQFGELKYKYRNREAQGVHTWTR